jgi:peptide/nickel transport system substrate-binding protein
MVDTWEISQDRLRYTFTPREGLHWHDGLPATAADVVASLQRWEQRDRQGKLLIRVPDRIEVVNDKIVPLGQRYTISRG